MSEDAHYVPSRGTFSVMTIDPIASVEYLDDPEATAASAKLVNNGYVIYLPGIRTLFSPRAAFREEDPYFVQQGLPQDIPAQMIDAGMSIPIAPQTRNVHDHPSKREPLKMATNPFPWPDCYLSNFATVTVRNANVRVVDSVVCELDKDERFRVISLMGQDEERPRKLSEDSISMLGTEKGDETEEELEEAEPEPIDEAEAIAIFRGLLSNEVSQQLTTVKFTYDLSRVEEIHDPRGYWEEVENIAEIVKASKARKEAVKIAAAEGDAARYDDRMAELLQGHQALSATAAAAPVVDTSAIPLSPTASIEKGSASRRIRIPSLVTQSLTTAKALLRRILCMSPDLHAA
ncbi:hypothetical protein MIND_01357100 [Mycena indigotica]|uniref:Uncharacterized protein n=1 Tax=Mycena indigotica TaxID=2126181 RepID=A0A8H6RZJ3_9AGAR|nr:uncharacterized protein MIND_01357100 [Mycena indigotica]KAF7289828.1 hypothetical protein MIND_01357100 [Mycena indigotica]